MQSVQEDAHDDEWLDIAQPEISPKKKPSIKLSFTDDAPPRKQKADNRHISFAPGSFTPKNISMRNSTFATKKHHDDQLRKQDEQNKMESKQIQANAMVARLSKRGSTATERKFYGNLASRYATQKISRQTLADVSVMYSGENALEDDTVVASLSLDVNIGFRRKLYALFGFQLLATFLLFLSLDGAFVEEKMINGNSIVTYTFSGPVLVTTLVLILVGMYYNKQMPRVNYGLICIFTPVLSLLFANSAYNNDAIQKCVGGILLILASTFLLSACTVGIKKEEELLVGYGLNLFVSYCVTAPTITLVLKAQALQAGIIAVISAALMVWFARDVNGISKRLKEDAYVEGFIAFYTDTILLCLMALMFVSLGSSNQPNSSLHMVHAALSAQATSNTASAPLSLISTDATAPVKSTIEGVAEDDKSPA